MPFFIRDDECVMFYLNFKENVPNDAMIHHKEAKVIDLQPVDPHVLIRRGNFLFNSRSKVQVTEVVKC